MKKVSHRWLHPNNFVNIWVFDIILYSYNHNNNNNNKNNHCNNKINVHKMCKQLTCKTWKRANTCVFSQCGIRTLPLVDSPSKAPLDADTGKNFVRRLVVVVVDVSRAKSVIIIVYDIASFLYIYFFFFVNIIFYFMS